MIDAVFTLRIANVVTELGVAVKVIDAVFMLRIANVVTESGVAVKVVYRCSLHHAHCWR